MPSFVFEFSSLKQKLHLIAKRFPLIVCVLFALILFSLIAIHSDLSSYHTSKIREINLSLGLTFFFALGLCLSAESFGWTTKKSLGLQLLSVAYGIFFFFSFSGMSGGGSSFVFLFLSVFGIIAYVLAAPYIHKATEKDAYYFYFYRVTTAFLFSFIAGIFLFGLGSLALFAINILLFSVPDDLWADWLLFSCALFAPLFGLSHIPSKDSFEKTTILVGNFPSFLIKFTLLPFVSIYFIILYIYSLVVLANFDQWPQGEVSWLVIGFSLVGYITYMYSYAFEKKYGFIAFFRKYFPYVVIPQVFMLFYAIFLRIEQYGLTMNRYFVVVFGIFLLTVSLYYIFSKRKALKALPLTLAGFAILVSVGPWSVYQLPQYSQLSHLTSLLEQAGMLKDGIAIPLNNDAQDVDREVMSDIRSRIEYLCSSHTCYALQDLVPKIFEENDYAAISNVQGSSWQIRQDIEEYLAIDGYTIYYKYNRYDDEKEVEFTQIYFDLSIFDQFFPLDVTAYTTLYQISSYEKYGAPHVDTIDNTLVLENAAGVQRYDLSPVLSQIRTLHKKYGPNGRPSGNEMKFMLTDDILLILSSVDFTVENKTEKITNLYINGFLLVK